MIFSCTLIQEQLGHCLQHDAGPWESTGVFHRCAASGRTWWAGQERSLEYGHCSSAYGENNAHKSKTLGRWWNNEEQHVIWRRALAGVTSPPKNGVCKVIHTNDAVNNVDLVKYQELRKQMQYYVHVFGSEMTKSNSLQNAWFRSLQYH